MTAVTLQNSSVDAFLSRTARTLLHQDDQTSIDVRARSPDGDTALHLAALYGEQGAVRQLLDAGAFIDEPGALGRSPLYYAVLEGQISVVESLLEAGADPDLTTKLGLTPREIALKLENPAMAELFTKFTTRQ